MTTNNNFLKFNELISVLLKSGVLTSNKTDKSFNKSTYLSIFYMIMNIKEFVRNLTHIHNSNNGKLFIHIEKRYLKSLAELLLNELKFSKNFITLIDSPRSLEESINNNSNLLIVVGSASKKLILEASRKNLNLVHIINDSAFQTISGAYQMHNNISDITKLVFLFALIDQVFANNTKISN
jgi:hypothetical protein